MLVLLYPELMKASEPVMPKHPRPRRPKRNHPPPGRVRARVARALALTASRLDRETARRAVVQAHREGRRTAVGRLRYLPAAGVATCVAGGEKAMHVSKLDDLERFTTLDGSTIREIVGPAWTPARNQSLAEATVPVGGTTAAHYHRAAEELYFFTAGHGRLRLGDVEREVAPGDCAVIPPGTVHKLSNIGDDALVLLCCCAPAYSDEDTVLVEDA